MQTAEMMFTWHVFPLLLQTGAMIRTPRLLIELERPGARKTTEEIFFSAFAQEMVEENGNAKDIYLSRVHIYLSRVQVHLDISMKLGHMTFMLHLLSFWDRWELETGDSDLSHKNVR